MFKEKIFEEALRLYAGELVVERVRKIGREAFSLHMEPRSMTIMYLDTRIAIEPAKDFPPSTVRVLYNAHLQRLADCIEVRGGVIDRFIGDDIIALWGATGAENHAAQALECAANALPLADLTHGVFKLFLGLNTGSVSLGNHGVRQRLQYTVMGDEINLASQMSRKCVEYDVKILIGETTLTHAGDTPYATRLVDSVRIKGKEGLTDIFTLANIRPT
jgi:adenylate cyclase